LWERRGVGPYASFSEFGAGESEKEGGYGSPGYENETSYVTKLYFVHV
jgi:hypothetical protein